MDKNDFNGFQLMLNGCLSVWDSAPKPEVIAMWFRCLAEYDIETVSAAFTAHMRDPVNGKFAPKPAHIIEQIKQAGANDGRPGPEEAWAISLKAGDESATVVWTQECAQAWGIAKPVMDLGDEVGARMAFREAYTRLVAEARARHEALTWDVSEGFDKDLRRIAVVEAVEAGRIPAGHYLSLPNEAGALLLAMSGKESHGIPPEIRERMRQIREEITAVYEGPSEADLERACTAELKRIQQAKVEQHLQTKGAQ